MSQESDRSQAMSQYRQWILFNISDPSDTKHVTSATQLTSLVPSSPKSTTTTPSSSLSSQQPPSVLPPVRLALLAPLAKRGIYNACRKACACNKIKKSGCVCSVLDISPVAEAWRKAVGEVSSTVWVRFDVTLPESVLSTTGGGEAKKFGWDVVDVSQEGEVDVMVRTEDVAQMVMDLATTVMERAQGGGVELGMVDYQAGWKRGMPKGDMKKLEVWLEGVEKERTRERKKRVREEGEERGDETGKGG